MADITVTAAHVSRSFPGQDDTRSYIATEALTRGDLVYELTTGKVGVADANASGKQRAMGIALETVGSGSAVSVLRRGEVEGFTVSSLDAGAIVYLSNTAGKMADAAGTLRVPVGRVQAITDNTPSKVVNFCPGEFLAGGQMRIFSSTEQTGTGASQNVAHGLGITPDHVHIYPTEHPGTPDTGAFDIAEGTHTSTNVVATVTLNVKFRVLAIAYA